MLKLTGLRALMKGKNMKLAVAILLTLFSLAAPAKNVKKAPVTITLTKDNTAVLNGTVESGTVSQLISDIRALDKKHESDPIYLFLYTPGGDVQTGLELIEVLNGTKRQVQTVTSFAASMGFQLVQNLGTRTILHTGVLMSHHARGGVEGEFGGLGESQIRSRLGLWEKRIQDLDIQTVIRTNGKQTLLSYQTAYDHELWLTAAEAVEGGYADQEADVRCDDSLSGTNAKNAQGPFGITIKYELDKCPLNTTPMNVHAEIPTTEGLLDYATFIQRGGGFGTACLLAMGAGVTKLCATNPSITPDFVVNYKAQFVDEYLNIKNHVKPMTVRGY